jgi:hypothetical protein
MDKTPAEIDEAWNAGKSIWFRVLGPDGNDVSVMAIRNAFDGGVVYVAYTIYPSMDALILLSTGTHNNIYNTTIYQLTPFGS